MEEEYKDTLTYEEQRKIAFEDFREKVYSGQVRDIHENKMSLYRPDSDTFFSCLSYSRYGSANKRGEIRERLLCIAIKIVTGARCKDISLWLSTIDQSDMNITPNCNLNPAIDSLAISLGAPQSLKGRGSWVQDDLRFKQGFYKFIDKNNNATGVWCKYALAYLFCQVYACDIYFYGLPKGTFEVKRTTSICKQSSYTTLDINQSSGFLSNTMSVCNKEELSNYEGLELVTPRNGEDAKTTTLVKTPSFYNSVSSFSSKNRSSEERSSEEDVNWFAIYLLFVNAKKSQKFELCYTDSENNQKNNIDWLARVSTYSLRVYEYDKEKDIHTNKKLRKNGAFCQPPPKGRRVHMFRFNPTEIGQNKILQVTEKNLRPRPSNGTSKPLYIYLYYREKGDNGTALMISRVDPSTYPGEPVFLANDQVLGDADGIFVVRSRNTRRAHSYVEKEMRVTVEIPIEAEK